MDAKQNPAASPREKSLIEKFRDKSYRDSYVVSHTRRFLARQMRKFRGEKSQAEFGEIIDKAQTVVSRLEDPKYGKWTLQTLFDVASKLDVAVIVRFVDFSTFMKLTNDMSDEASRPVPYDQIDFSSIQSTVIMPSALAYNLLPHNFQNYDFQLICNPMDFRKLDTLAPFNLAFQERQPIRRVATVDINLQSAELIDNLVNPARQQNPIADIPHPIADIPRIGMH